MAAEKSGRKRKQGGKGKPFKAGDPNRHPGTPFPKGVSPNPGGRPKSATSFRDKCRTGAAILRRRLVKMAGEGGEFTDVGSLVRAFEALADRGGYLPADKQATVLLKALESPALKDADRRAVLDELLGRPAADQPQLEPAPTKKG